MQESGGGDRWTRADEDDPTGSVHTWKKYSLRSERVYNARESLSWLLVTFGPTKITEIDGGKPCSVGGCRNPQPGHTKNFILPSAPLPNARMKFRERERIFPTIQQITTSLFPATNPHLHLSNFSEAVSLIYSPALTDRPLRSQILLHC